MTPNSNESAVLSSQGLMPPKRCVWSSGSSLPSHRKVWAKWPGCYVTPITHECWYLTQTPVMVGRKLEACVPCGHTSPCPRQRHVNACLVIGAALLFGLQSMPAENRSRSLKEWCNNQMYNQSSPTHFTPYLNLPQITQLQWRQGHIHQQESWPTVLAAPGLQTQCLKTFRGPGVQLLKVPSSSEHTNALCDWYDLGRSRSEPWSVPNQHLSLSPPSPWYF